MVQTRDEAITALVVDASQATRGAQEFEQAANKIKVANSNAVQATERVQQAFGDQSRALDRLIRQIDPAYQAQQRLAQGQALLDRSFQKGTLDAQEYQLRLQQLQQRYGQIATGSQQAASAMARSSAAMDAAANSSRNFRGAAQQIGFQVADVATQISMGTNAIQAFAVQGGQLLGAFGPIGAVLGAGVVVVGALAAAFSEADGSAKDAKNAARDYADALELSRSIVEESEQTTRRLNEERRQQAIDTVKATIEEKRLAETMLQSRLLDLQQQQALAEAESGALGDYGARAELIGRQIDRIKQQSNDLKTGLGEAEQALQNLLNPRDGWNSPKSTAKALEESDNRLGDYMRSLEDAVRLVRVDASEREIAEAVMRAQNLAMEEGNLLTQEQIDRIKELVRARQDQVAAGRAADKAREESKRAWEQYGKEVERTARDIGEDVSETLFDSLTGNGKAQDIVDFFKNIFKRIAVEALNAKITLPIAQTFVGSMPGLFGIQAPAGQNAAAGGAAAGGATGIAGIANFASMWNMLGLGSGSASVAGSAHAAGAMAMPGGASNVGVSPGSGGILAAIPVWGWIAAAATVAKSVTQGSKRNSAMGVANTLLGPSLEEWQADPGRSWAITADPVGVALSDMGVPSFLTQGGMLASLFGGKPSVGPNYSYHVAGGRAYDPRVDNGADLAQAQQEGSALGAAVQAISYLLGGQGQPSFGVSASKDGYQLSNVNGVAGVQGVYQDIVALLRAAFAAPGGLVGGDNALRGVLNRSQAADPQALVGDLQFAQGVLDLNRGLTQTGIAIRDLNRTYDEQIRKAAELGLETGKLAQQRDKEIAKLQEQRQMSLMEIEYGLAARVWRGRDDPAQTVQAELLMFDLSAQQQRIQLRDQLDALGELTTSYGVEMMRRLEEALAQERVAVVKAGNEALLQAEKEAAALRAQQMATAEQSALATVAGISQYVRSISVGDMSALAPEQQFGLAQSQFNAVSRAALAGDFGSLQQVTTYADSLLRAARQQYGSGQGYADAFAQVTDVLSRLASVDPDQLTQRAFVTETRSQTQTLVDELQALRREVAALRLETQQSANRPVRAA